jgi:ubiquinone/menaquinone biosynthesis C-methylase UbiE
MKIYEEYAAWWPLLSDPSEYEDEADFFREAIAAHTKRPTHTVLDLGSGTGNVASHLKSHYTLTLTDISEKMLDVSRGINSGSEHIAGDMRTLRLGKTFDAVFVHDAVMYMTTRDDLRRAIETAYIHCADGGVALFVPDSTTEIFESATDTGGSDDSRRGVRFLSWSFDPDPADTTFTEVFSFVFRHEDGSITYDHDEHTLGLFSRKEWTQMIVDAGFQTATILLDQYGRDVFAATK